VIIRGRRREFLRLVKGRLLEVQNDMPALIAVKMHNFTDH